MRETVRRMLPAASNALLIVLQREKDERRAEKALTVDMALLKQKRKMPVSWAMNVKRPSVSFCTL